LSKTNQSIYNKLIDKCYFEDNDFKKMNVVNSIILPSRQILNATSKVILQNEREILHNKLFEHIITSCG
jgi:hypothetical protein